MADTTDPPTNPSSRVPELQQHDPPIEPDHPAPPTTDDVATDDGYASSEHSAQSSSLASSVRDYQFENSRRYHKFKEGLYQFPNDLPEQEREDMKHTVAVHLLGGKLHNAPLDHPQKILDIGTGTGSWAIDSTQNNPD
jgi:hypothetical protein